MDKVFEGVGSFLTAIGPAGYPTSLLGGVLMVFFWLRKQEAGVRNDIVLSLQRLQKDKERLQAEVARLQGELDAERKTRRDAEDAAYNESKRADGLLDKLTKLRQMYRDRKAD